MDRSTQLLYRALVLTGALGEGTAISPLAPEPEGSARAELVFRTTGKDWVLSADTEISRESFLRLAETAMGHALDFSDVPAETGLVYERIAEDFKVSSDRLRVTTFPVKPISEPSSCGFCGSSMTATGRIAGWPGCSRCQRLLRDDTDARICPSCLTVFGGSPALEEHLQAMMDQDGPKGPDLRLCPKCRSADRLQRVTVVDLLMKAVNDGKVSLDQLKAIKFPGEFLQLLNLRVQLRRN